ncbi:MAG: DUF4159 domain-containing protein, partial [Phycisphaerae bacterium]|nr:DUF4159 domain-containing protein [Phycisphaerae bacterium]
RAETAFRLLFLSRGRHPIFLSKLRYDGDWSFRPRDVANLTKYAGHELEVPLNWQTVGLDRSALEWSDSPVLMISGEKPPTFSDADVAKLGEYIRAGGLLYTESNRDSAEFTHFAEELAHRLFPNRALSPIPPTHPLYNSVFNLSPDATLPLEGVSNGSRLLMIHSPGDISRKWHPRYEKTDSNALQMGINIAIYGTGRRDLRNRIASLNVTVPPTPPLATVPIARVQYGGNWDPEPGAWERMAKLMQLNTGFHCDVRPIPARLLDARVTPIADLTGTDAVTFSSDELTAMNRFVTDGGLLLIDACGGSPAFARSIHDQFIDKIGELPEVVDDRSPLFDRSIDGMRDLSHPRLRNFAETHDLSATGQLLHVHRDLGDVIFTPLDLTSGLLGTNTWGITGFEPDYAQAVVNNVIILGVRESGRIEGEAATTP